MKKHIMALLFGALSFSCAIADERQDSIEKNISSSNLTSVNFAETDSVIITSSLKSSLELFEKTKFNLAVSAIDKNGKKLKYTWYVDKQNGKGFVKAGSKPILAIIPKSNMLGWQYYCEVSNGVVSKETPVSTITAVRVPVKLVGKPKSITAFEGNENQGFSVSATGYDVKYQWQVYKVVGYNAKGKTVYDWVDIEGAISANYKPESDYANNGLKYRCKVYNDGSSVYSSGVKFTVQQAADIQSITLYQKPEKAKDAHIVSAEEEAAEGFDITLTANAAGYKIKYQWYLNGEPIAKATKKTLTIKKPLIGEYEYSCKVYNEYSKGVEASSDEMSFVLSVTPLKMPLDFEFQVLSFTNEKTGESFVFCAVSKSKCVIASSDLSSEDYDILDKIYKEVGDKIIDPNYAGTYMEIPSSVYSYKRLDNAKGELKITMTKEYGLLEDFYESENGGDWIKTVYYKRMTVKKVLSGNLYQFDEHGVVTFETDDGEVYTVEREIGGEVLPDNPVGKIYNNDCYFKNSKTFYLIDDDYENDCYVLGKSGSYTYKKLSNNLAKYTMSIKGIGSIKEAYIFTTSDRGYYWENGNGEIHAGEYWGEIFSDAVFDENGNIIPTWW